MFKNPISDIDTILEQFTTTVTRLKGAITSCENNITKANEEIAKQEAAKDRNLEAISKASTAIKNIEKLIGN